MEAVWFQKDELATLGLRSEVRGVTKAEARAWRARGESGSYQGRLRGRGRSRGGDFGSVSFNGLPFCDVVLGKVQ